MGTPELAPALEAIVGPGQVLPGDTVPAYAVDGRAAPLVAFPASVEEVRHILVLAWERGLGVVPAGAGTRLGWGGAPRPPGLGPAPPRPRRPPTPRPGRPTPPRPARPPPGAPHPPPPDPPPVLPPGPARAAPP